MNRLRRALASTIAAIALTLASLTPAGATELPGGGACSSNCWANHIEFRSVDGNFMYYYHYAWDHTSLRPHFDWDQNGCSLPKWAYDALASVHLDFTAATYARFFLPACKIHDFGYRNFGGGRYHVTLGDSSDDRRSVDDRFHDNMLSQCADDAPGLPGIPGKWACDQVADIFYRAVRCFAADNWGDDRAAQVGSDRVTFELSAAALPSCPS